MDEFSKQFYLLNKNIIICKFEVFGKEPVEGIRVLELDEAKKPWWISDIESFLMSRHAPKSRENIKQLLKESGCDTVLGYLSVTHALTLTDTFWVKPIESELDWDTVSLYKNDFNEVIAKTAFGGGLYGGHLATTSPEYSTDGTFAKCWVKEENIIKMLKRGSSGARNAGLEPYSEYYAW